MDYNSLLKLSYKNQKEYEIIFKSRFKNECATILDFKIAEHQAFYLNNQEILLLITKITECDKALDKKTNLLPSLALVQLTKQNLINEIKQTNDIENVYSTKKEIKETLQKIDKGENKGRFKGLISKYVMLSKKAEIPLKTCEDIRMLYDELVLSEVLEDDKSNAPDGLIFRKAPVSVYSPSGKALHNGLYPEDKIINSMSKALNALNDKNVNPLLSAAVFHYWFSYIHPFYDGNGRTDRFISSYIISKALNPMVSYKFSYIIKKHQAQYYKMFSEGNNPRNKGELTPFILQFLEFILEIEKELNDDIDKKINTLSFYENKLHSINLNNTQYAISYLLLIYALFDEEGLTTGQIGTLLKKSYNTILKELEKLNALKLIRTSAAGKKKLYELDLNTLADI